MIKIYCNENLNKTLKSNNIKDYVPAYEGESAGLDLYNSSEDITVMPSISNIKGAMISTGLHVFTPKGYVTLIKERGSITKTPLKYRAGVVDEGYTGEIFVNLVNISNEEYTIKKGQKLPVQIIVVKCDNQYSEIDKEEYLNLSQLSQRKSGKVGSSD
jgi:dUTP pyrophosphatase